MPIDPKNLGNDEEEIVLKRRIERRLEARSKWDMPWARRIVGAAIILAAFVYGWRTLNQQSKELIRARNEAKAREAQTANVVVGPSATPASAVPSEDGMTGPIGSDHEDTGPAKLDSATMTSISDCTKGANAFRLLDFNKKAIADGSSEIESVFKPVLVPQKDVAQRSVQLQNVRIRTKSGEELRLHATPQGESGRLYFKLFRVANDGLPESIEFPDSIKDLKDQPLSDQAITRFLMLSETPGRALEVERHESWTFPDRSGRGKSGAQVIWSGDRIFELQVYLNRKFLTCSRGTRAGSAVMSCKCVERKSE